MFFIILQREVKSTVRDYGILLKTAREARGMTQEQAAEQAGVSVDSWYAYEANKRLPHPATVNRICRVLQADWLAMYFLEAHSGEMNVLPEAHARELPSAVLALLNRVLAFNEKCRARELMELAEDGVIDEDERETYDEIVDELDGIIEAALAVKFPMGIKKDRPDVGASRRPSSRPMKSKNNRKSIVAHRSESVNHFVEEGGVSL